MSCPARTRAAWATSRIAVVTKLLNQPVSVGGGLRYWAEGPDSGPHDWGLRRVVTLLFPK